MSIEAASALRALQPAATESASAIGGAQSAGAITGAGAGHTVDGPDFASVLADIAASGLRTVETGEATALAGLQGDASVQKVVEAVMSAEQTLKAAIAVRDKVVQAYQEISRMAI